MKNVLCHTVQGQQHNTSCGKELKGRVLPFVCTLRSTFTTRPAFSGVPSSWGRNFFFDMGPLRFYGPLLREVCLHAK
jgi:hypothetical protein